MSSISNHTFAVLASIAATLSALLLLGLGLIPGGVINTIGRRTQSLSKKSGLLLVLIPAISFLVNTTIAITKGVPQPLIQDEHSYLLAADTFAHGRVSNPTPAYWEHFETPHELMRPTYMSKYPPAQGLTIALGQLLTAQPIAGVWLISAAACAVIYWMLLGFLPPIWAMLGGFIAVVHPQFIQWSQNFWGGSVAVLGGAMVLGAWVRLISRPGTACALTMGIGLAILANSRPYEGLVFATPLLFSLIVKRRSNIIRLGILIATVLLPMIAAMGWYNYRVTGHALRMPFTEYTAQYDIYPKFWFLPKHPAPEYRNDSMREIHTLFEQGDYDRLRTPAGLLAISAHRLWTLITLITRPSLLLIPFALGVAKFKDKTLRWIWITAAIFAIGLWLENFFLPHYAAPIVAALLLITLAGWEKLSSCCRFGQTLSVAIAIGVFSGSIVALFAPIDRDSQRSGHNAIIEKLPTGKHLIFVQYLPGHLMHDEWVYNGADIENARIIWARHMGPEMDMPVIAHYTGRKTWLLSVGEKDVHLVAYPRH